MWKLVFMQTLVEKEKKIKNTHKSREIHPIDTIQKQNDSLDLYWSYAMQRNTLLTDSENKIRAFNENGNPDYSGCITSAFGGGLLNINECRFYRITRKTGKQRKRG